MSGQLTEDEFERVRRVLDAAAGLATDGSRRSALASVVRELSQAAGGLSAAAYLDLVESSQAERQRLLEASVVGETQWLRTPPQVEAMADVVLPRLLAARAGRPLSIWSAGCSTGEEVWSLAMLATEAGAGASDVRILGTDVSARALETALAGRYGERSLAAVNPRRRLTHLVQVTADPPTFDVGRSLRAMVELRQHDLVHDVLPVARESVDVLFCRNVMIYFSRERTRELVERFARVLRPGGVLVLGHSESLWQLTGAFEVERIGDAFLYRRSGFPPPVWSARASSPPPQVSRPQVSRPQVIMSRPTPAQTAPQSAALPQPRPAPATAIDIRAALIAGDHARAEQLATARVAKDAGSVEAHYLLGLVLATAGRDGEAVVALRRATYLDPGHGLAHFLLATSLSVLGADNAQASYDAAADALERATADAPAPLELEGRSVAELAALCRTLSSLNRAGTR